MIAMDHVKATKELTHTGALSMLAAAVAKAEEIGQPQCIVIVDRSGEVVAELRMTGAKFLSMQSALAKARTSASIAAPSHSIPEQVALKIAAATAGAVTSLPGGLPIFHGDDLLGGIGVGSGSGEQDEEVAQAALHAL